MHFVGRLVPALEEAETIPTWMAQSSMLRSSQPMPNQSESTSLTQLCFNKARMDQALNDSCTAACTGVALPLCITSLVLSAFSSREATSAHAFQWLGSIYSLDAPEGFRYNPPTSGNERDEIWQGTDSTSFGPLCSEAAYRDQP